MNYVGISIVFGVLLAVLTLIIEIITWNIIKKRKKNGYCYIENNNQMVEELYNKWRLLKNDQYKREEKNQYVNIIKTKDMDEIKHARNLLNSPLGEIAFWGILLTAFTAALSKVVLLISYIYVAELPILEENITNAVSIIGNFVMIPLLGMIVFFIYKSINNYQRDKYLIGIMDETIKEMEYREDKIEAVKTDSKDDVIGQNLSKE